MSAKPLVLVLALATTSMAPAAFAQEPGRETITRADATVEEVSIRVPISDLNIDRRAGAQVALTRMNDAARQICSNTGTDLLRLSMAAQRETCARRAVDTAVAALDSPVVTALNSEQQGQQPTMLASRR